MEILRDYETVTLGPTDDVAAVMNANGTVGWETAGIAFVTGNATRRLLKRPPRPRVSPRCSADLQVRRSGQA